MKMLKIVVLAVVAFLLVAVRTSPVESRLGDARDTYEVVQLEEACVRQGGICVHSDECDPSNQPHMADFLCPAQRHLGILCCYL